MKRISSTVVVACRVPKQVRYAAKRAAALQGVTLSKFTSLALSRAAATELLRDDRLEEDQLVQVIAASAGESTDA